MLIGGVACDLAMEQAGLEFRLTKDLDIVLCIEALDAEFVQQFWSFVDAGQYEQRQRSSGEKECYRFVNPADATYPIQLEFFSRTPIEDLADKSHLTPIPIDDEVLSLSAILLDDDYYECIKNGREEIDGIPVLGVAFIIPYKMKAWLDNTQRKDDGGKVQSIDIKKHRQDVFRLFPLLSPELRIDLPDVVKIDMQKFIAAMPDEKGIVLKDLGIMTATLEEILGQLSKIYGLES